MKTRSKFSAAGVAAWWTLGLPAVFLLCLFFFFAGFFGSTLFSQQVESNLRPKPRSLGSLNDVTELELWSRGNSGDDSFTSIPFQILSWKPRALYFPGFATAEQCDGIIKAAKVSLIPSSLALRNGETPENTKGIRTSSGTFMSASEDQTGILDLIEKKIERATMIPRTHGEPFNVLRYEIGQKYNSHYDAFNPEEYGPQKSQRIASFLLYLSNVEEGGETMFPFENGQNMDLSYDFRKCVGLKVKPRRGDGLLFYSLFPNGTIDPVYFSWVIQKQSLCFSTRVRLRTSDPPYPIVGLGNVVVMQTSLHGSCPVIKGQKWVATKWIRNEIYDD